ncbi:MAG: hypothetical protein ABI891_05640 [Acidobacteriota bacterium]
MFSSNSAKVLFVFLFATILFSSCWLWQKAESETPAPTPFVAKDLKSDVPFLNKEPENFQAEFVVTASGKTDKTFMARNGGNRRLDYNVGEKNQFSVVQTIDGKGFLTFKDKKIYAENSIDSGISDAGNPFDFLTTEWLNQKAEVKFEKLDAENRLMKYRAVLGEIGKSEAVIWIDEKIGLPVKQEFYSTNGEQKILTFTFEMKNFKPQTEESLFEIPKDFRKVSIEEFRKSLRSEN